MKTTVKDQNFERESIEVRGRDIEKIESGVSQVGIGVIMILAGLVGIWGVVCFICGLATSGSVSGVIKKFITAVTGL